MRAELKVYEEKMAHVTEHLGKEYGSIRAGRANPSVLDKVSVDYYGTPTPINQLAAVGVAEARVLTISPWDASLMHAIEKAILTSDIGINPTNDGRIMRLVFPAPTEERRKQLSKEVLKFAEEAKVAVRNVRRDAIDKFKAMKKTSEITEDDLKALEDDAQKLTDKFVKEIDKIGEVKIKEIMEI
ncbi:MAG: ribosome recycling factor [Oscillospiraceae bacterium]|nr:ribosome recycling factor [Oscillospiraceae bacterium]